MGLVCDQGFREISSHADQAALTRPMAASAPAWMESVLAAGGWNAGYRRARCTTKGVAKAHGNQDTTMLAKSRTQS